MVEVYEKITPFACDGFLEFWDDEAALCMIENRDSFWYSNDSVVGYDADALEAFYRALFIDRTVKLYVWCHFYMTSDQRTVGVAEDYLGFPSRMNKRAGLRTTALTYYGDLGSYGWKIKDALEENDTHRAFELCDYLTRQINLLDYVVFEKFLEDIFCTYDLFPIFELPDGSQVDIAGAVDWAAAQQSTQE